MKPTTHVKAKPDPGRQRWKVLLVDDHPVVREGLAQRIRLESDLEVSGTSVNVRDAWQALENNLPDLVVVDLSFPSGHGLDLIKDIHARHPQVRLLVFSMHDENIYGERALLAGAQGYVMKDESPEQVLAAIRKVLAGKIAISANLSNRMLQTAVGDRGMSAKPAMERLSNRELEVFEMIGRGMNTREIATSLRRSAKTVETHRLRLKVKLQITANSELIVKAACWVQETGGKLGMEEGS
jgi:DNA-binding NarL/FixJ family response regulator